MAIKRKAKRNRLAEYASAVDAFVKNVGIDPVQCRIEVLKEGCYGWSLQRDQAKLQIFLQDTEERNFLSVLSPILKLPQEKLLPFYRRLLEINYFLVGCSTAVKDDGVFVMYERMLEGLDPVEIEAAISQVSFAAVKIGADLSKEFGAPLWKG